MSQANNLDEKIERIAEQLEKDIDVRVDGSQQPGLLSKIKGSNGFMTAEGKWISKPEVHAVAIPAGFLSSAFMLPNGLGVIPFISLFFMWRKGFHLAKDPDYEGHWNDVIDESAYSAGSMAVTIAFWIYLGNSTIDITNFMGPITRALFGL